MAKDLTKCDWVVTIDDLEEDGEEIFKLSSMDKEEVRARLVDKAYKIMEEYKRGGRDTSLWKVRSYKGYSGIIFVELESNFISVTSLTAMPYVWLPELK